MKGIFITGSGTDVGKTFVALRLIKILNEKYPVKVRKPIESDCEKTSKGLIPKDAALLAKACNTDEPLDNVCRFRFESCSSTEKASKDEGVEIALDDLVDACKSNINSDYVVVEGAGGIYSPIAKNALNSDLAQRLGLPVVLVVNDELGAINQALLVAKAAEQQRLDIGMIVLNQVTKNKLDNKQAIQSYTKIPVLEFNKSKPNDFNEKAKELIYKL